MLTKFTKNYLRNISGGLDTIVLEQHLQSFPDDSLIRIGDIYQVYSAPDFVRWVENKLCRHDQLSRFALDMFNDLNPNEEDSRKDDIEYYLRTIVSTKGSWQLRENKLMWANHSARNLLVSILTSIPKKVAINYLNSML